MVMFLPFLSNSVFVINLKLYKDRDTFSALYQMGYILNIDSPHQQHWNPDGYLQRCKHTLIL